ncbi:MAG TPA: phosphate regulon sensor histidine kinase PhoR [Gammaproteobacteria bacterium]
MASARSGELFRFALFLVLALLLGAITGYPLAVALAVALAYAVWHLYWLFRLEHWLARERGAVPPEAPGIWGDVFQLLFARYRRNRKRKQRIARLMRAFQESTAAMPDGAVALNQHWQIAWFNDAAVKLLGLARQDIGQRIANLLRNPLFIRYLAEENFDEPLEIVSPLEDERRLSLNVVSYGEGEHLLLVRDTTRMFRLMQMRREFVANASHELRSPLTVIAGYLEALSDDERLDLDWEAPISEMCRQADRMSQIIADLLELSRLETSDDDADGDVLDVRGMLARIREEALAVDEGPRDVTLAIETDARLRGVEKEIYSAFSNLVFNAMRYTQKNGKVTICWSCHGKEASLSVTDTGIGIPKEQIPRVTERFYRVDSSRVRSKGGTGLGLAIVKHVLQRHGARLEIESALGKGSTFTCIFPAQRIVTV